MNDVICVHGERDKPLSQITEMTKYRSQSPFHYWEILTRYWVHETPFVNVEQDIVATESHIDELFSCPQPFCAFGFYTWLDRDVIFDGDNEVYYVPLPPQRVYSNLCGEKNKPEFCNSSGIGLIKFGKQLTKHLKKMPWFCLDWVVTDCVRAMGEQFHMHYPPVEHERDPNYYQKETIRYSLWEPSVIGPVIYDINGRIIATKTQGRATTDVARP